MPLTVPPWWLHWPKPEKETNVKNLIFALAMVAAAPAFAFNGTTYNYGNGFQSFNGTDSSGQSFSGQSYNYGNGFTNYNWNDSSGSHSGTSYDYGNGFRSYNGN
jgi:hypothetical protein